LSISKSSTKLTLARPDASNPMRGRACRIRPSRKIAMASIFDSSRSGALRTSAIWRFTSAISVRTLPTASANVSPG
jgi:hypothetical protein